MSETAPLLLGTGYILSSNGDECSQIPYGSVLMARTRLAQHIVGLQPREYFDCNPPGTGHYTYQLWKEGRVRRTAEAGSREILLVAAQDEFVSPTQRFTVESV